MTALPTRLRRVALAAAVSASLLGCGGGDDATTYSVTFTPSATPQAARLVKLVQKSKSGGRLIVEAVIYGPDVTLDMYSFVFDVEIGDTDVLRYVDGSDAPGNALVAFAGQSVDSIVGLGTLPGGGPDLATVVVGVSKLGGGLGNGVAGASAVVVELAFDVRSAGTTTLTITGSPARVLDSNGVVIGTVTFDAASATVQGTAS